VPVRRPTNPTRALAAAVLLTLAALASCTGGTADTATGTSPPRPTTAPGATTPGAGWQPTSLTWRECDLPRNGRCATLEVPLDWDRPDGPTIELAIGRIPAGGTAIGPLLLNPGGPGASGLDFLSADPVSPDLAEDFDLVAWDPRGIGGSEDLACGDAVPDLLALDPDPDDADEQAALDEAAAAVSEECAALDGELLPHLRTRDVARDVDAVRRALGAAQISYLGFSYGTSIGLQYAQQFPERVRAMVLDGVVDPSLGYQEFLLGQAEAFEAAFDTSVAACRAAEPGRCGVDDLAAAYDEVARRAEQEPLDGAEQPVGPSVVATAAIQTLYQPDGWQQLGPALAAASTGDGGTLWDLAAGYYSFGDFTSYAAVVCIDSPPPSGAEAYRAFADEARRRAPRFGGAVANELASCATWPAPAPDAAAAISAPGTPTILVVGNTGDPATPYANAVAVAAALEDAVLLTVESDGHTAYGSDRCATGAIDTYLIDLQAPPEGTVCP
jgi:pimeloyl-ACP methyl ester carboxylesterase